MASDSDNQDLDSVLDELEGKWAGTPVPKDDRSPVPDGKYQARVDRTYFECDRQGTQRLKWDLVIVIGPCAKRHLFRSNPLTQDWIESLKRDLARAGVTPPETMRGLRTMVEAGELLDRVLEVQAKTKPGKNGESFQNVYINAHTSTAKRTAAPVSAGERATAPVDDEPPPVGDGDLPF
jgi:hypothetical protein